jgi:hypothetical protein
MPKLTDQINITIKGFILLTILFRKDPLFNKKFLQICTPYQYFLDGFLIFCLLKYREAVMLTDQEFEDLINELKKRQIQSYQNGTKDQNSNAFVKEINELAYKWKFRSPLASSMLFFSKLMDDMKSLGIKMKLGTSLHAHTYTETEPLDLGRIPPWLLFDYSPKEIKNYVEESLQEYVKTMKTKGMVEYPSSLQKHAEWWFKHYVKKLTYDAIAQEEAYSWDGSSISYAKNVGRAVREFSKIMGISGEQLK